jgi:hypothetical protein
MLPALMLFFVVVMVALYYWTEARWNRRRVREYFAGRVVLDDAGFYRTFYQDSGIPPHIPTTVRRVLAQGFGLPREQLQPDDCLDAVVRPSLLDELDFAEVVEELKRGLGLPICDEDCHGCVPTLGSITEMCARVARRNRTE